MWIIDTFISYTFSILFPASCFTCEKEGSVLCLKCLQSYKQTIETPSIYITSYYSFHDKNIKRIIHAIKYFHRRDLIEPLTENLVKAITLDPRYSNREKDFILIPIPMPRLRTYMRGYNQAELIAHEISKKTSYTIHTKILIRAKSPKRQVTSRTRGERLTQQHNSFKVAGNVQDMNIILVDDVTTTGATLGEARRVLLKAGARSVEAVTLAH